MANYITKQIASKLAVSANIVTMNVKCLCSSIEEHWTIPGYASSGIFRSVKLACEFYVEKWLIKKEN